MSDIKNVLDEIDCRIKVIDAIQELSSDSNTDELNVLHPLISQAKRKSKGDGRDSFSAVRGVLLLSSGWYGRCRNYGHEPMRALGG